MRRLRAGVTFEKNDGGVDRRLLQKAVHPRRLGLVVLNVLFHPAVPLSRFRAQAA